MWQAMAYVKMELEDAEAGSWTQDAMVASAPYTKMHRLDQLEEIKEKN